MKKGNIIDVLFKSNTSVETECNEKESNHEISTVEVDSISTPSEDFSKLISMVFHKNCFAR